MLLIIHTADCLQSEMLGSYNKKRKTPCLLFILQSIYLHNLSPHMSSQPITSRTYLPTATTLSIDQSNRSPGFLNFQLTNTTTWLWGWLLHRLSKCQSLTTVLLRTPITQMIFFNPGKKRKMRQKDTTNVPKCDQIIIILNLNENNNNYCFGS